MLHAWRHHRAHGPRPVPQTELARWLGITQGQLSRIENGRNRVRDLDKLIRYARMLAVPAELLWFDTDDPAPASPPTPHALRLRNGAVLAPAPLEPMLIDSLQGTLKEYVRTDNVAGPQPLLPIVTQQVKFAARLARTSRGLAQPRLRLMHARFAEFLGWLHQDSGNLPEAAAWTSTAARVARETGNDRLLSYILMRQSNLATDAGDPRTTITLARAALQAAPDLPPRQRAMALRQLAYGHARLGHSADTVRAIELAKEQAARSDDNDDDDLTGYCTVEYIAMEAAHCLIELGRPEQAILALEPQLSCWHQENRRDLGRGLALLALAFARIRQPDQALDVAQHALQIVAETRSTRTELELYRVMRELHASGAHDHAAHLRIILRNTLA
ncbi:helix-turn-helix domain-containing protein [Nocardia sp. NPDC052316]|uniref:helix-turn-helix domain-containing protein n=1 Tax=Nocardia sp. NPDC052316 TaxID=3364329 RepID=UPI0037C52C56